MLSSYLVVLYNRDKRLAGWVEETKADFGYLKVRLDTTEVEIMVGLNAGTTLACPLLAVAPDAKVSKNLTQRAQISSVALNVNLNILTDYHKNKELDQRLFEAELSDIPVLAQSEIPPFCVQYFSDLREAAVPAPPGAAAVEEHAAGARPPPPPGGSGAARGAPDVLVAPAPPMGE